MKDSRLSNPGLIEVIGKCLSHTHLKLLFLSGVIVFSLDLSATDYYVSPSGNNFDNGTSFKPYRTISYAITRLKPGDNLFVRSGSYHEKVSVYGVNGSKNSPVSIIAFPGERPVIDGNGVAIEEGGGLVMIWTSYISFSGFEVRNSIRSGIVCGSDADHCTITDCVVNGIKETGIGYYGKSGIVEKCTVFNACMSNDDGIYTPPETWGAGINIRNNVLARQNVVHDVWGEGLSITLANNGIVEDNIIYNICSVLLYVMNCQDCIIRRNLVYMTKPMGNVSSVGLGHWNENETNQNARNIIINNVIYNCRRNFYNDSPMNGSVVANNTFVNSTNIWNVQFSNENSSRGSFCNNIVLQEGSLPCIFVSPGTNTVFRNNLFNKSYDSNARGIGDLICNPGLFRTGETAAGKLQADYFRLQATSPAIDKGITLKEVTDDILQKSRDRKPDIGAHEH